MKRNALAIVSILFTFLTPEAGLIAQTFKIVHANGTKLMSGKEVVDPIGFNLGNWFMQEPYMMGVSANPILQIACGGTASGSWVGDDHFTGGTAIAVSTLPIDVSQVSDPAPESLYRSARVGSFSYKIPDLAPNSGYLLRLHFCENEANRAGERIFGASINGTPILTNFDVFAIAGGKNRAIIREIPVTADSQGALLLKFWANGLLNGLELKPVPSSMDSYFQKAVGGAANYAAWRASWLDNYTTQADIRTIKGKGFNCVRVPLVILDLLDSSGLSVNAGEYPAPLPPNSPLALKYLDRLIEWCNSAGVYILPDLHRYPSETCWVGSKNFKQVDLNRICNAWKTLAMRYKNAPAILGFDLLNEPPGFLNDNYRPTYLQIRDAIRSVDRNHLIVCESNIYADLGDPKKWYLGAPIDSNMAVSAHFYEKHAFGDSIVADTGRINLAWKYATTYSIPFIVGEFGEKDNTSVNAIKEMWRKGSEGTAGGYLYWNYKKPDSIRCLVSVPFVKGWSELANFVSKGAFGKISQEFYTTMMSQAKTTNAVNNVLRIDILDSLTRNNYSEGIPYSAVPRIPGRMEAAFYDLGANGKTSFSSNSETRTYLLRNDCVSVIPTNGGTSSGWALGYTVDGEYERYSVNAKHGAYVMKIRYASGGGESELRVLLNGVSLTEKIKLPATSGWFDWRVVSIPNVSIGVSGKATLEIHFDKAALNLDSIEFR